jgi:hypothetical protein
MKATPSPVNQKMGYARECLSRFQDLELVMERRMSYVDNDNVDSVFLLRKNF